MKFNSNETIQSLTKKQSSFDSIRVVGSKLHNLLLRIEELLNVKLTTSQHVEELSDVRNKFDSWYKEWKKIQTDFRTIRSKQNSTNSHLSTKEKNALIKLMNFYEWNNSQIVSIDHKISSLINNLDVGISCKI